MPKVETRSVVATSEAPSQLERIEKKLDQVLALLEGVEFRPAGKGGETGREEFMGLMRTLTTKQHAALQMLLAGASNGEIAERFGVTSNTAKVYVRGIAKKVGENTRAGITGRLLPHFEAIDAGTYKVLSGGLPLDWHEKYTLPDPYRELYHKGE